MLASFIPRSALEPFAVEAMHPDAFVEHQFDLHQGAVIEVAKTHRAALSTPPISAEQYIEALFGQGLPIVADKLREYLRLI